jgi:hypothetical protein
MHRGLRETRRLGFAESEGQLFTMRTVQDLLSPPGDTRTLPRL